MLISIEGRRSIHRIGQISCHRDQLDGMTPSFQEWALTTRDGDGLKQENMMDSIEGRVWSPSYLNLGYFVSSPSFVTGLV